jgi:hypothetical protein
MAQQAACVGYRTQEPFSACGVCTTKFSFEEAGVNRSNELRKNAENCVALAEAADSDPKKKRYARMATAWISLADTQAWLDGEMEKKSTASVSQDEA